MILVTHTPVSGLEIEQCSIQRRLLVPDESGPIDLYDTHARNRRRKNGVDFRRRFRERVSWVLEFIIVMYVTMCVVACSWAWQGRFEVHRVSRWIFLHSQRPARLYN